MNNLKSQVFEYFKVNNAQAAITSDDQLQQAISGLQTQDIYNIFDAISLWVLVFGLIGAVIAFIFAGISFLTSRGDAQKLSKANPRRLQPMQVWHSPSTTGAQSEIATPRLIAESLSPDAFRILAPRGVLRY